jgi:hypothetical protein
MGTKETDLNSIATVGELRCLTNGERWHSGILSWREDAILLTLYEIKKPILHAQYSFVVINGDQTSEYHVRQIQPVGDSEVVYRIILSSGLAIKSSPAIKIVTSRPSLENKRSVPRRQPSAGGLAMLIQNVSGVISAKILDISPFGFCVLVSDKELFDKGPISITLVKETGQRFKINSACEVAWRTDVDKGFSKVGLKIINKSDIATEDSELAAIDVSDCFLTGTYQKPLIFSEIGTFLVERITKGGMVLRLTRSDTLLDNSEIEVNFLLPKRSRCSARVRIISTKLNKKNMVVDVLFVKISDASKENLSSFLLLFHGFNPQVLKTVDLKPRSAGADYEFGYVTNREEYLEILELRSIAYKGVGKLAPHALVEVSQAPLDDISRIVICKHFGRAIASVAVAFPKSDTFLDVERGIGRSIPSSFPTKENICEISRLCVHPDYQNSDLLIRMVQEMAKIVVESDRRFVITSADDKMLPFYRMLGWTETEMTYAHPFLNGMPHKIIFMDRNKKALGLGVNPILWRLTFGFTIYTVRPDWIFAKPINKLIFVVLYYFLRVVEGVLATLSRIIKSFGNHKAV